MRPRLLASTTSHKAESILTSLEIFGRLGLTDVDLNLHHVIEGGVPVEAIDAAARAAGVRIWVVSGGWCDFFHAAPAVEETFRSVDRQVAIAGRLGVSLLRLFFGRLAADAYSDAYRDCAAANVQRLADRHPAMSLVFENHDGASLRPDVCGDILARVGRPNVGMNFDPINFERAGANGLDALGVLRPFVQHVHLKGLERGEYCEFGVGDVDLDPVLRSLMGGGYAGSFSVEYEGRFDKTARLYQSVQRARAWFAG
jgi:sugar phosphate isomerase/epimerase